MSKNFSSFENLNTLFTALGNKLGSKYDTNDGTETDLQNGDFFPFYDSSKSAKKKTAWSNIKAKLKTYFDTIYSTFSGSYSDLTDKPTIYNKGVYYGTCTSQAANQTKAVTIAAAQGFVLEAGATIYVKFDANNTYSATAAAPVKLNVNNTGAKNVYYGGSSAPTGTNTTAFGRTNYINQYIYDGTYWVWQGSSTDNNTTYSAMSASELTTGTATTSRTVRADYLKSGINSLIDAKTDPLQDQIGDLTDLQTQDKSDLVNAINEVAQGGGGGDYYSPSDTEGTDIADGDYFPFYDISANSGNGAKRKFLWSNIVAKIKSALSTVATTGNYADLSNKPFIPNTQKCYTSDAEEETDIQDQNYFPFSSNDIDDYKYNTTWANIKAKLKAYFDTIYSIAAYVKYQAGNEINFKGGAQTTCWFNYRNADTGAAAAVSAMRYKFANYSNDTSKTTLEAASFTGNAATASAVKDSGNGNSTTFAYSAAGLAYGDYTWLAGWNGYQLRAVAKSQFSPASSVSTRTKTVSITVNAYSWGMATITESSLTGCTVFMSIFADVNNAGIVPINIVGRGTGSSKQFYVRNVTGSSVTATITVITIYFRN